MRILIMLMLLMSTPIWAKSANVDGLTPEQQAEIQLQIARTKAQNRDTNITLPNITKSQVKEYVVLGESIAKALGACAKEMGVAVNDFANSKVGILATVLIVWNVAGESIMGFIVGISLFVIGTSIWLYLFRKICVVESITYHENGKKKEVTHYNHSRVEGTRTIMFLAIFLLIAICCLIMFV